MKSIRRPACRVAGGAFYLLLSLLLQACAVTPSGHAVSNGVASPPAVELSEVPFFPQERYQCGPAALATVLTHAGVDVAPDTLVEQVYLPAREGSLQLEMIGATRRHGRVPYPLAASLDDLLREVAAGHPVLVLQNLGLSFMPAWHYAVVVGYDRATDTLVLRSGTTARRLTGMAKFTRTWARGGHWALVITPPETLPVTAREAGYLRAVAELERVGQLAAAASAYRAAQTRWPHSEIAALGLANSRYALGDRNGAMAALRTALTRLPKAALLHNNLAQVLLEGGELTQAHHHAQRAVAIGGPHSGIFKQTLADIERRLGTSRR